MIGEKETGKNFN